MNQDSHGLNVVRPARWQHPPSSADGGIAEAGASAPLEPDLLERVGRLEAGLDDTKRVLARLEPALAKLRDDTAEMKLRLSQMPNVWELAALMIAMFGLSFVLLRYGLPTL